MNQLGGVAAVEVPLASLGVFDEGACVQLVVPRQQRDWEL